MHAESTCLLRDSNHCRLQMFTHGVKMRRRLALESETSHHAIGEPSEDRGDTLAVSGGSENFRPVPLAGVAEVCRTCVPSAERGDAQGFMPAVPDREGWGLLWALWGCSPACRTGRPQATALVQAWAKQTRPAACTAVNSVGIAVCLRCSGKYENTFPCSHQES